MVPYGWELNGTWELRLLQGLNDDGLWPLLLFCFACLASSSPLAHNSSRNRSLHLSPSLAYVLSLSLSLARPHLFFLNSARMKRDRDFSWLPMNSASRPRLTSGDDSSDDQPSTSDHKNSERKDPMWEEHHRSPIRYLKRLTNWIKAVLIHIYTERDDAVLDIACGKGGDLKLWDKAWIGHYVGIDIANGSIEDARNRYNRNAFCFSAKLVCADCFQVDLGPVLKGDGPFDVCSVQFALQYSWSTEERARRALHNVSTMLRPGGRFIGIMPDADVLAQNLGNGRMNEFGNSIYRMRFGDIHDEKGFPAEQPFGIQYEFQLQDAGNCSEWLVPFLSFQALAEEYGLQLVLKTNILDFLRDYSQHAEFLDLLRKWEVLGDPATGNTLSNDEWKAANLYLVFAFRKCGKPAARQHQSHGNYQRISEEEVIIIQQ